MEDATRFDVAVAPTGYTWWYLDALSDDGRHGLTIIAFIGSVFSPYYASARRRAPGAADPLRHCAINVALYGPGHHHWAMTERSERALQRSATTLRIGPSGLAWDGGSLVLRLDEVTAPIPKRLRGTVRLTPQALPGCSFALDAQARHHWSPIAPLAQAEVDFERPGLRWSGPAYFDSNRGTRPLEADFVRWDWSRANLPGGRAGVLYDVTRRSGEPLSLALHFDAAGKVQRFDAPPLQALPASGWRVQRGTRSDASHTARVLRGFEDGPFYARSLVESQWLGERVHSVHESLSLDRFASRWVQAMLPFRMPRRGG